MRQAYVHEAVLVMGDDADDRAPGGAITVALCGVGEHEPPCPLAAHHTSAKRRSGDLHLRILFAAPPNRVDEIRDRIDAALSAGSFPGPDGRVTRWRLISAGCAPVESAERAHARRLLK